MSSDVKQDLLRSATRPAFLIVAAVLLIAAVGLNAGAQYLKLTFKKQSVPLPLGSLAVLPARLGPWQQISIDTPLPPDIEHTLQTSEYISRHYADTRVFGEKRVAEILKLTGEERNREIAIAMHEHPDAVVHLHMTYYTAGADTVAHIPDRCFVGGGFDISEKSVRDFDLGRDKPQPVSFLEFEDRTQMNVRRRAQVAYLFQTNGAYEFDAITGVRKRLQDLRESHAYYAKIEMMIQQVTATGPGSPSEPPVAADRAARVMEEFLRTALPEVERVLPDFAAFKKQLAEQAAKGS
jgi:hypothetical protein